MNEAVKLIEEHLNQMKELNALEKVIKNFNLVCSLQAYAKANGSDNIDWRDTNQTKYCINYNYELDQLEIFEINDMRDFSQIYFATKKACKKAIELHKQELIEFFKSEDDVYYDWIPNIQQD